MNELGAAVRWLTRQAEGVPQGDCGPILGQFLAERWLVRAEWGEDDREGEQPPDYYYSWYVSLDAVALNPRVYGEFRKAFMVPAPVPPPASDEEGDAEIIVGIYIYSGLDQDVVRFVRALREANGEKLTTDELMNQLDLSPEPKKLVQKIPPRLRRHVGSQGGKGGGYWWIPVPAIGP